jgi:hypothetical protein
MLAMQQAPHTEGAERARAYSTAVLHISISNMMPCPAVDDWSLGLNVDEFCGRSRGRSPRAGQIRLNRVTSKHGPEPIGLDGDRCRSMRATRSIAACQDPATSPHFPANSHDSVSLAMAIARGDAAGKLIERVPSASCPDDGRAISARDGDDLAFAEALPGEGPTEAGAQRSNRPILQ